ncbi:MAG: hypothetical protein GC162_14860 [Planctomycetes bacterium]|nr:hypothetical protein [Planctomycetota bacterium]
MTDLPYSDTLSPQDQTVLDALIDSGFDLGALDEIHHDRAHRIMELLGLLDHLPTPSTGDLLVPRTLELIESTRRQEALSQQIDHLTGSGGGFGPLRVDMRELVATAAMFLIGVSLLWPMLSSVRSTARQVACQANLAGAGMGLISYAADNRGSMPATKSRLGSPWWLTNQFDEQGNALSNSAHLFVAVRDGYVTLKLLSCSENPEAPESLPTDARDWPTFASASFSFQNQYSRNKASLEGGPLIAILADKNPFFETGHYRMGLARDTSSFNHGADGGQNVLMTNGQVTWLDNPHLANDDNIFHAGDEGFDNYTGLEGPTSVDDSFLVP